MYASLQNHLYNLVHLAVAFYLLFILFPKLVTKPDGCDVLENIVSNFIKMVFVVVLIGYILVILKVYEFLGIFLCLECILIYTKNLKIDIKKNEEKLLKIKEALFDYVDQVKSLKADLKKASVSLLKKGFLNFANIRGKIIESCYFLLIILTMLYSLYLRMYDALINAAPGMSDSYVTLKWMKTITQRILFPDGIYPEGFHIYLATLQKFAFIDPIYIHRYFGSIDCLFIVIGIYFVITRVTGDKASGIIGICIYGILISYLYDGWERQAANNSQEFGYVFVVPTIFYFGRYIRSNKKADLITAFIGLGVTALVHTISFAFIAIGVFCLVVMAACINIKKYWNQIKVLIAAGFITTLLGLMPLVIGILYGKGIHSASASFLVMTSAQISIHALRKMDFIGVASLLIMLAYLLFNLKKAEENFMEIFFFIVSMAAFFIYYLGGYITKSVLVSSRLEDLWSLMEPLIIGISFYTLSTIFKRIKMRNIISLVFCVVISIYSVFYLKPKPIIPYKMEYNSNIEQYLRISSTFTPTTWMIVSQQEGYAVVMGKGYHLLLGDFLKYFSPNSKKYLIDGRTKEEVKTPDIFLYQEKKVFRTAFKDIIDYDLRAKQYQELSKWVDEYKKSHSNLSIYYEDNNIRIYRIHQGMTHTDIVDKIWGISK